MGRSVLAQRCLEEMKTRIERGRELSGWEKEFKKKGAGKRRRNILG